MKKKVNKSELIRGMITNKPAAKAPEIHGLLKKEGVSVSLPLVYQAFKKIGMPKTKSVVKGPKKSSGTSMPTNELFTTMQAFVDAAGGLDKAIAILTVFKK